MQKTTTRVVPPGADPSAALHAAIEFVMQQVHDRGPAGVTERELFTGKFGIGTTKKKHRLKAAAILRFDRRIVVQAVSPGRVGRPRIALVLSPDAFDRAPLDLIPYLVGWQGSFIDTERLLSDLRAQFFANATWPTAKIA